MRRFYPIIVLGMMICGAVAQNQLVGSLTNGLMAYYPLNGNFTDASGNGNDLTNHGVTFTLGPSGNLNGSALFDGLSTYLEGANLVPDYQHATFSCWAYADSSDTLTMALVSQPRKIGGTGLRLSYNNAGLNNDEQNAYVFDNTIPLGVWHFYSVTADGSNLSYYVDGYLIGQSAYSDNGYTSPIGINIGREGDNTLDGGRYFKGSINDVGFWNRALTGSEVSQLYAIQSVPESSIYALFGLAGLFLLIAFRRQRA